MGTTARWVAKAKHAAATLKSEYEAGKRGDDTPAEAIWPSPRQQLDGLLALWKRPKPALSATTVDDEADAEAVAEAMRGIDWAAVRAATSERTGDAAKAMRSAADHVDWSKVQPVAAQVSSALIAAVASGRIGVGGRLGSTVARTILDQGGLAQRVGAHLQDQPAAMPVEFKGIIEATSREADPGAT
ncbi:MAG: hypothetical protein JWN99_3445 [Ilumatobacteraceae bacterium]|nr:hypothetical protein [Ilumatobacteraceae bacterium]